MPSIQQEITKNIALIEQKYEKEFSFYRDYLISYNRNVNLTAITEKKEVSYKHFLDSLAGSFLFHGGETVADVGAGAGFPSLPLAIVKKDVRFKLFESVNKKCDFLRSVIKELALDNAEVVNLRAEDAARGIYREGFDAVVARAVARMNVLSEYCLPLVKRGGKMIAYKAETEEIGEAERAIFLLGGTKTTLYRYELPEEMGKRVLAVVEKGKNTPEKYPRGNGKERKNPL